ncbi:flagellar export chaperone FliS [Pontibacter sp. JAM-7]|uniref:flagellar export chaperone FliS n=1 Tax=Pontibacter sp. JAM-7 TaxID=3366581 RepID=UPI003AF41CED
MNPNKALNQYKSVGLNSALAHATPHQQILMLLNGALERIATAKGAIDNNNIELKGNSIGKAISIIGGLQASLTDLDNNEVSQNLDRLYTYMYETLMKANTHSSIDQLNEVAKLLIDIKNGWEQIPQEHHNTRAPDA